VAASWQNEAIPTKSHHTPRGFRNNYIGSVTKSLGDVLRWQLGRIRNHLPRKPNLPTPQVIADLGVNGRFWVRISIGISPATPDTARISRMLGDGSPRAKHPSSRGVLGRSDDASTAIRHDQSPTIVACLYSTTISVLIALL
jgi:hypothetical protein